MIYSELIRAQRVLAIDTLTVRTLTLLLFLGEQREPMKHRFVAAALDMRKPNVTRATTTLSRAGLLQRGQNPKDGRDCLLSLTQKGRDCIATLANAPAGEAARAA